MTVLMNLKYLFILSVCTSLYINEIENFKNTYKYLNLLILLVNSTLNKIWWLCHSTFNAKNKVQKESFIDELCMKC